MKRVLLAMIFIAVGLLWSDLSESQITVSSESVAAGDSVLVTVSTTSLIEEWDVISFQFEMSFDPSVVSFLGHEEGDIFTDGLLVSNELEPGVIRAAYSYYEPQTGEGVIIRLNFLGISGETVLDIYDFKYNTTILEDLIDGNIAVSGGNQLPVADAGEDMEVDEGVEVELDGSGSFDPEGSTLSYIWSAPPEITLNDPTLMNPGFMAPLVTEDTQYTFSLTVNDGEHNSLPDDVIVTVINVNAIDSIPAWIDKVAIHSISPNPFNPSTTINFLVPYNEDRLSVNIYTVKGQLVKSYEFVGLQPNTLQRVTWEGVDDHGNRAASGVYLCSIKGRHSKVTERMLLLK